MVIGMQDIWDGEDIVRKLLIVLLSNGKRSLHSKSRLLCTRGIRRGVAVHSLASMLSALHVPILLAWSKSNESPG